MYRHVLGILFLVVFSSHVLGGGLVHCKEPKNDVPEGVLKALTSTVAVKSSVALNVESLEKDINLRTTVGSGFIAHTDGYVVVSGHRIAPFLRSHYHSRHTVILHDCRAFAATVVAIGGDEHGGVDAILLKIVEPPTDLVPITRSATTLKRTAVYALGAPYGWMNTVYTGVLAETYNNRSKGKTVFAHVQLQEGISGGPLVTENGYMLGSAEGVATDKGYNGGMPISVFVPMQKINTFLAKHNL
jgi:S1-C subfamily serine protease